MPANAFDCVNQLCDPFSSHNNFDGTIVWGRGVSSSTSTDIMFLSNGVNQINFNIPADTFGILRRVSSWVSTNASPFNLPYPSPYEIETYARLNGVEIVGSRINHDSSVSPVQQIYSATLNQNIIPGDTLDHKFQIINGPLPSAGVVNVIWYLTINLQ
jgi:hypothetical protein